jgi:hypothetical protein
MAKILGPDGKPVLSKEAKKKHPVATVPSPPTQLLNDAYQQLLAALGGLDQDEFLAALRSPTGIEVGLLTILLRDTLNFRGLVAQLPQDSEDPVIRALIDLVPPGSTIVQSLPPSVTAFRQ